MARPRAKGMEYFPHDTNALNDEKIEYLTSNFGASGYAFYFIMLERIYRTENYELDLSNEATITVLQKKTFSDAETFQKLIEISVEVGLFDRERWEKNRILTSNGIKDRAEMVEEHRENSRKSYQKRVSSSETTPETGVSAPISAPKVKESKVKESKEKNITIPTEQDVVQYCREQGYQQDLGVKIYRYYKELGWKDNSGKPVKSWKAKCQAVWFKPELRVQQKTTIFHCNKCGKDYSTSYQDHLTVCVPKDGKIEAPPEIIKAIDGLASKFKAD